MSQKTTSGRPGPDLFDRWWPRARDVGAFLLGAYWLDGQFSSSNPNLALAALAASLVVVPVASLAQRWLRRKIDEDAAEREDRWSGLP